MLWCTRTATSALDSEVSATSPSIPAVLRPALRCVTCRTLSSVFDLLRSISFCRLLTFARSPSCAALKILCRSRRTSRSAACQPAQSQPTASRSTRGGPSGPFTTRCLTCPLVPAVPVIRFKGSPATRQHAFAPGHPARYPASYTRPPAEGWPSPPRFPVAFQPPAFASWASCSAPGNWAPLTVGLPDHPKAGRTLTGFPHIARMRHDWSRAPSVPRGQRCPHSQALSLAAARRIATARPCLPGATTRPREFR